MIQDGKKLRLAIMVGLKGRGSNMAAISQACAGNEIEAEVAVVVGQSSSAPAIERAQELHLTTAIIPSKQEDYGAELVKAFKSIQVELVCLAGYMRMLPLEVIHAFPNRVLNIHPALLPKFGGTGMYGERVHEAVIASGEKESGCTVHFVTEQYDEGEIVLQMKCPVEPGDDAHSLAHRVLELEHLAYPSAIQVMKERILDGKT